MVAEYIIVLNTANDSVEKMLLWHDLFVSEIRPPKIRLMECNHQKIAFKN